MSAPHIATVDKTLNENGGNGSAAAAAATLSRRGARSRQCGKFKNYC